jgi:hypothetical protein
MSEHPKTRAAFDLESPTAIAIIVLLVAIFGVGLYFCFKPDLAVQRTAIHTALTYDKGLADDSFWERVLFGDLLGASDRYVEALRLVPLKDCPWSFQRAYEAHLAAWETRDKDAIRRTWKEVQRVALEYGVIP